MAVSQGFTLKMTVIVALSLIAQSLMADTDSSDLTNDGRILPSSVVESTPRSIESLSAHRQALLLRLQQLDQDNQRLRQQLSGVQSADSAQAIEKVLDRHSRTIEQLRHAQLSGPKPIQTAFAASSKEASTPQGFNVASYQAPAASGIDSAEAVTESTATQSAASMWALEVAGTSGVLALFGALILLFVTTVLRKSYWMPRKRPVSRASAQVSKQGLAADLAEGYHRASTKNGAHTENRENTGEAPLEISDPETIRKDQLAMAKMLEQGLQLSEDDMALVGAEFEAPAKPASAREITAEAKDSSGPAANGHKGGHPRMSGIAHKQPLSDTLKDRQKAERQEQKASHQTKNPLADQYDQLGGGFSEGFDDGFDELFDEAARVSEAKPSEQPAHSTLKSLFGMEDDQLVRKDRRSDEEVFRSIREKTCDYVAPAIEEGDYIVEEGCDDLDKYMAIQYIAPEKIELDEAKEQRSLNR